MTVSDASLDESGSNFAIVAATPLLLGVTRTSSEAYKVIGTEIDDCVFAESSIGRVILPNTIESIGDFAFGKSNIEELVYPDKIIELQYARQFKGTKINKLLLPQNIFDYLQVQGRRIESLFNPCDTSISDYILY